MQCTTIGVDLAKSVFQVSIANQAGKIVDRRRLSRSQFDRFLANQQAAELVMETCATAHFWARKARDYGHQPRLLHAPYVRPYVRRNKTDAADADALVRAGKDPDPKPVPVKTEDQQALQGLHRIRRQWRANKMARIHQPTTNRCTVNEESTEPRTRHKADNMNEPELDSTIGQSGADFTLARDHDISQQTPYRRMQSGIFTMVKTVVNRDGGAKMIR